MLPSALQSLQRWKLDLGHSAWSLQELIKHNSNLYICVSLFDDSNWIEVNPTFQVLPQDLFELCSCSTTTSVINWVLQVREKCMLNLQLQTWTARMERLNDLHKVIHKNCGKVQFYYSILFSYFPCHPPSSGVNHENTNEYMMCRHWLTFWKATYCWWGGKEGGLEIFQICQF